MEFLFRKSSNIKFNVLFFFWILIVIVSRAPFLFKYPRFWAEEGTVFFKLAYENSTLVNFTTPLIGYYTLFNVLSSELATLVPLEVAPLITTVVGLMIFLVPFLIVVFTEEQYWNTPLKKIMISSAILFFPNQELWLNSTAAHFFLGLIAILILMSENFSVGIRNITYRILLLLGGLSSPVTTFLTPAFIYKFYLDRKRESLIHCLILILSSIIQGLIILNSMMDGKSINRFQDFSFMILIKSYLRDSFGLMLPFSRNDLSNVGIFLGIFFCIILMKTYKSRLNSQLIIAFIFVSIFSLLGSLKMTGGLRYSYLPTMCVLFILINELIEGGLDKIYWKSGLIILTFTFTLQIIFFQKGIYQYGPKWKEEVLIYRTNPNYPLKIWPNPPNEWEVMLKNKN